ncbi:MULTISPECIES: futalosine hydrolase [Thermoactinomyces]|uniref:Futalosine hydrolase n=1 Tax=Thermoactinomyces daqus TaxID=1329516 RepID=A0A7W2AFT7_9BACL|nr:MULTISPECIES: futalosine hydrolase [Thermoactinomyces]MBA4541527.1 futalosine hydrolase [Thermoactinomyces daqus]MBH8597005.1 futalosine hydrolase [Thermoactinomyces sp. CICC 10523]MBH8603781.1 futalosine hydrolase [Thermoactinomyces sp. CICC 10522]MBH8607583.1 futalosine hydrolase [Thermoactinomyces sp. CICC 10521]
MKRNEEGTSVSDKNNQSRAKRVLVVTAVSAEREAVMRGLKGASHVDVLVAGVGPVAAAASTAAALARTEYDLVVSAGIGGGFAGRAEVGTLVVAEEIICADLGAETEEGFCGLDELGFGTARFRVEKGLVLRVTEAVRAAGLPVTAGPVLTVSTVTGTASTAARLAARVPGAAAEGMEGFGVATAARNRGIPVLEIRAISNVVGPRDRSAWRIDEALEKLAATISVLQEVIL